MHWTEKADGYLLVLGVVMMILIITGVQGARIHLAAASQQVQPEELSLHEAEILVYLLPEAREVRKDGRDVGWELNDSTAWHPKDFYTFWLFDDRPNPAGSVTIGDFSVNKHTGDVWDTELGRKIRDHELEGAQMILRDAHHVDVQTLEKYGSLRP